MRLRWRQHPRSHFDSKPLSESQLITDTNCIRSDTEFTKQLSHLPRSRSSWHSLSTFLDARNRPRLVRQWSPARSAQLTQELSP